MALETYTGFIKDLVITNPTGNDLKSQGDDHIRGTKFTMQNQFSGLQEGIEVTASESDLNNTKNLDGYHGLNLIINPDSAINQRGFAGDWTPLSFGDYGYDRWKKHADGMEQVVEGVNIQAGDYTLSWSGGGNGSLDGSVAAPSPITATLTGGSNISCVVPRGVINVKLEYGKVATPYHVPEYEEEYARCQRYYQKSYNDTVAPGSAIFAGAVFATSAGTDAGQYIGHIRWPVHMRGIPTVTLYSTDGSINAVYNVDGAANYAVSAVNEAGRGGSGYIQFTSGILNHQRLRYHYVADAEI